MANQWNPFQPRPAATPQAGTPPGAYAGPQGAAPGPAPITVAPTLSGDRIPNIPLGSHLLRCVDLEFVGQGQNLLVISFVIEQSTNPALVGTQCAYKRPRHINHRASDQIFSDNLARVAVPLSGYRGPLDQLDPRSVLALTNEFMIQKTLNGRPIAGLTVGCEASPGERKPNTPPDREPFHNVRFIAV